jgi:hypothetical protein
MALSFPADETAPARHLRAITPHASNTLPDGVARGLYVGGGGNVAIVAEGDTDPVILISVLAGSYIPTTVKAVRVAGTTATNLVAIY